MRGLGRKHEAHAPSSGSPWKGWSDKIPHPRLECCVPDRERRPRPRRAGFRFFPHGLPGSPAAERRVGPDKFCHLGLKTQLSVCVSGRESEREPSTILLVFFRLVPKTCKPTKSATKLEGSAKRFLEGLSQGFDSRKHRPGRAFAVLPLKPAVNLPSFAAHRALSQLSSSNLISETSPDPISLVNTE